MDAADTVEINSTIGLTVEEADRLVALYISANPEVCAGLEALLPLEQVLAIIHDAHEFMYSEGGSWRMEVPTPMPAWITAEDIKRTVFTWSRYYAKPVTGREAVEMMLDVARLGSLLAKHGGGAH